MAWKYIMVQVEEQAIPILFPDQVVHADVWKYLRRMFHNMLPRGATADPACVSAGFVEGVSASMVFGESESLGGKQHRPVDVRLINNWPYEKGRDLPDNMSALTEGLILQRTVELLLTRIEEITAGHGS